MNPKKVEEHDNEEGKVKVVEKSEEEEKEERREGELEQYRETTGF